MVQSRSAPVLHMSAKRVVVNKGGSFAKGQRRRPRREKGQVRGLAHTYKDRERTVVPRKMKTAATFSPIDMRAGAGDDDSDFDFSELDTER